ncbi:MAG: DmsE family decaheme c-type cytochrome [Betaproteobacteria bacterium]|nr:DmsE family decaheme c-type cytochrome [Betaproteobacteria bacterium]
MKTKKASFAALLLLSGIAFGVATSAQGAAAAAEPAPAPGLGTQYSESGADTCLQCHPDATPFPQLLQIFKTKHGVRADKRTPFAAGGLQCEACHGPGAKHAESTSKDAINSFKNTSFLSPEERNKFCLNCHRGNARTGWHASTHESNNVACSNCHKIHADRDPVLATATQADVCYNCHKKQRADFNKPSVHPVRFGRIACNECHSPHGSSAQALLAKPTVNQTCYTCHAEKRGPFLWEHAPAAEDCTLCHTAHGSVYRSLLRKNAPLLCQQCHTVAGHPAVARTGAALPGGTAGASGFLLAGSCMNCHSQVHGSNHPSGVKLMR